MIVVTGATGQLGTAVVERLLVRMSPDEIGVSVRDPEKAASLAARGVRVRRGDFDEPATLRSAFDGATKLLLISAATVDEDAAVRQHRTAIGAASAVGVERIVYTSHMGASPASAFSPARGHAATEAALAASGLAFTALRNGFYTATTARLLAPALQSGRLALPEDGPVSWTSHADLADAATLVLTERGFDGPTPALTGSEALDLADIAAIASELTGREITRTTITDQEYRDGLLAHGTPEVVADLLLGMFLASRRGEFAAIDPTLEELLGRRPQTARDALSASVAPTRTP